MKKIIALLLIAVLLGSGAAMAEQAGNDGLLTIPAIEPVKDTIGIQRDTEIVVGSTSSLSGYFTTDLWGNNTADMDVRALIHGYSTVASTDAHGMVLDGTVVREFEAQTQADGSKTYTLTLSDELLYNDGTPITAKDYVFSLLMVGSPAIAEIGGTPQGLSHIAGYEAYRANERKEVSGLRLLSDYSFSITIGQEYLNYFYALALLNVTPYPIQVIAPGCEVRDDGHGAYIGALEDAAVNDAQALGFTPGQFDADMLAITMLDPKQGYVLKPRVTSGPYALVSYDSVAHEARFIINERYIGNFEGQRPHIERIALKPVTNETMVTELASGQVDILNKVTSGITVGEGMTLAIEKGQAQTSNYLRAGFAYLSFACEQGITSSVAVRKAVAHLIDHSAYVASVVGSQNATPVYGYYGMGQWMTVMSFDADAKNGLGKLVVADELSKLEVPYDLEAAKHLLIQDGWTLNASGEPYQEGEDDIRYREEDGELVPLNIRWAKTENNQLADATERALEGPFAAVGIGLEVTEIPFTQMLAHYYRQVEREYDMFFLASNFGYVADPYYDFHTGDEFQGVMNTTGLRDETLMELAQAMRETHPTAIREYTQEWLAFQRRWVELMPMVPLYSNVYFDFYANELRDYNIALHTSWASAIPYAWIDEAE